MADEDRLTRMEEIVASLLQVAREQTQVNRQQDGQIDSLLQVAREHNQVARQQNERLNALAQSSRESDERLKTLVELVHSHDESIDELREA
ncbi:MAG TPA: hypothetical protein VF634_07925, partial [Pyrinomonadaceae bacterium]